MNYTFFQTQHINIAVNMSDEDGKELADSLLSNPNHVVFINLNGNQISDDTAQSLSKLIQSSSSLTSLTLKCKKIVLP